MRPPPPLVPHPAGRYPARVSFLARLTLCALFLGLAPAEASAQTCDASRVIRFEYEPTALAQVALWIETSDGRYLQTVTLTEATSLRGIGNRPGALQMNSAFRWPFGRRESVLPIWAHRRATSPGAAQFRRVIFQQRIEGYASRQVADSTRDDYFCLSFDDAWKSSNDPRDTLDAITCPSVFSSDKGRFITAADVSAGYSEPWENLDGSDTQRPLDLHSLYPPRRDITAATGADTDDVDLFVAHAAEVMPEIDAVTMATPVGGAHQVVQFTVPSAWTDGDYVAWIEVNVEGDYNADFDPSTYPTPLAGPGWDSWAMTYGYPYRAQPSVVYRVPFTIGAAIDMQSTDAPVGYGSVHGEQESMTPMDGKLTDDPTGSPGSGVDRLARFDASARFSVRSIPTDICTAASPRPECGQACDVASPCPSDFLCTPNGSCEGICDDCTLTPAAVSGFELGVHPDVKQAHHFATLAFNVPQSWRQIQTYDVRMSREPILSEEDFIAAEQAKEATLSAEALQIPTDGAAGSRVEVEVGGLTHQTHYFLAIRAVDLCNNVGDIVTAEVETTAIHFTTVSPCFIATAAYGTPLASEIGALRRFRDRHLMSNPLGRVLVETYYALGPHAAALIEDDEDTRSAIRALLDPLVDLVQALE